MKQVLTASVLIVVCCLTVFAQNNEQTCQKLQIQAPQRIHKDSIFKVVASFKENNQNINSPIRWKTIKGDEIVEKIDKDVVELDAKGLEEGDSFFIIAETDDKCRSFAMAAVFVEIRCLLPFTIDEYGKLSWNDERARLDNVGIHIQSSSQTKDSQKNKLFVFLEFSKDVSKNAIRNRIRRILDYLSTTHAIKKEKMLFLISESDAERVRFQFLPPLDSYFDNPLVIKGEDFEKLQILFQAKTPNRKK